MIFQVIVNLYYNNINMETWAEGNSNAACRNLIKSLNATKLNNIIKLCKIYINNSEKNSKVYGDNEVLNWLDNNLTGFFGEKYNKFTSEKALYLRRSSSFESIVLFLLNCDIEILRKLVKMQIKCHNPKSLSDCGEKLNGGSSTFSIMKDFIDIDTKNTNIIIKILKKADTDDNPLKFGNLYKKHIVYDPLDTSIIDKLNKIINKKYNTFENNIFCYSNRTNLEILDIWKMIMFLYKKPIKELKELI